VTLPQLSTTSTANLWSSAGSQQQANNGNNSHSPANDRRKMIDLHQQTAADPSGTNMWQNSAVSGGHAWGNGDVGPRGQHLQPEPSAIGGRNASAAAGYQQQPQQLDGQQQEVGGKGPRQNNDVKVADIEKAMAGMGMQNEKPITPAAAGEVAPTAGSPNHQNGGAPPMENGFRPAEAEGDETGDGQAQPQAQHPGVEFGHQVNRISCFLFYMDFTSELHYFITTFEPIRHTKIAGFAGNPQDLGALDF